MTNTTSRTLAIDPNHTSVRFTIRHLMIAKVRGTFGAVSGTVTLGPSGGIPVAVDAEVPIASVATNQEMRDGHLKSPDFFDAAAFPAMTFRSTAIEPDGDADFALTGDLTIKGVTKPVTFEASFTGQGAAPNAPGTPRYGFEAKTTIKRSDFGLTFNIPLDGGGLAIGDDVAIELDVEAA